MTYATCMEGSQAKVEFLLTWRRRHRAKGRICVLICQLGPTKRSLLITFIAPLVLYENGWRALVGTVRNFRVP